MLSIRDRFMIKKLTKYGNTYVIKIDKVLLEAAGITENALFQVIINPNGGLFIQSIEDKQNDVFDEKFKMLNKKYSKLMQRLADL